MRDQVEKLLDTLDTEKTVAVVLFGSYGRGEVHSGSDIDVMVVVDSSDEANSVRARLNSLESLDIEPIVITTKGLAREAERVPSFIVHLTHEGRVLAESPEWEPFKAQLSVKAQDTALIEHEIDRRAKYLGIFAQPERFQASPATALSHIYRIARSIVIARLVQEGEYEFRWQHAFKKLAELRPDLAHDIREVERLRPYYEFAHGRRPEGKLPKRPVKTEHLPSLLRSAKSLAR